MSRIGKSREHKCEGRSELDGWDRRGEMAASVGRVGPASALTLTTSSWLI